MLLLPSTPPSTSFVCDRENNHDFYCHVHIIHHYRKGIFNEIVNSGGITNIAAILILFRRKKTKKKYKTRNIDCRPFPTAIIRTHWINRAVCIEVYFYHLSKRVFHSVLYGLCLLSNPNYWNVWCDTCWMCVNNKIIIIYFRKYCNCIRSFLADLLFFRD